MARRQVILSLLVRTVTTPATTPGGQPSVTETIVVPPETTVIDSGSDAIKTYLTNKIGDYLRSDAGRQVPAAEVTAQYSVTVLSNL